MGDKAFRVTVGDNVKFDYYDKPSLSDSYPVRVTEWDKESGTKEVVIVGSKPAPEFAIIEPIFEIDKDRLQHLFDNLWCLGFRPTGCNIRILPEEVNG